MILGILQCDDVPTELQEKHGNYHEMFIRMFKEVDPSLKFKVWRCHENIIPNSVDEADAWLITGSKHGVYDEYEWINNLSEFVRLLYQNQRALLGVCFGHQLLAHALGGSVIKHPGGWGVGVSVNEVKQQKPWMNPPQNNINILVSHQDQVVSIPSHAQVVAASDFCSYYMIKYGNTALGIQGHPEFTKEYAADLLEDRRNRIDKNIVEAAEESFNRCVDSDVLAKWLHQFILSA